MAVGQACYDLLEEEARRLFFQLAAAPHISKEVPSSTDFHHEDNVLLGLKRLVKAYDIAVAGASKDVKLLHDLALGLLILEELLIDRFKSDELACEAVDREVDLAERTLPHDFTNLVVLSLSLGWPAIFEEGQPDFLLNF